MTIDEIREKEKEYCRGHVDYFIETYGHYEDKDAPELIQPFRLWDGQRKALQGIVDNRLNIILKARQLGITWLVVNYVAWLLTMFNGRTVIGMSRTEDEAKELVRRLDMVLSKMPEFLTFGKAVKGRVTYEKFSLDLVVHYPGEPDSVFKCFPSSPGATRSFTADLLIFDEWAYQEAADEIWASAFPVINRPTGGKVIGLSTNKRGSLFEKIYTGDNKFNKIFLPWYTDPRRTKEWYEDTKREIPDTVFQEYPETPEQAMLVPGGAFFPEVDEDIFTEEPLKGPVMTYFVMDYGLDMLAAYWIQVDSEKNAQIIYEFCRPNMTISQAAEEIISITNRMVDMYGKSYRPEYYLAPPDLWNRSQESGKSRAILFGECGLPLTKSNNSLKDGCAAVKEYLRKDKGPHLTILNRCAPSLYDSMKKIQKDKKRPEIYANDPHDLTHYPDALRYFCIYWTVGAEKPKNEKKRKWHPSQWEDYYNASPTDQAKLIEMWGEPDV